MLRAASLSKARTSLILLAARLPACLSRSQGAATDAHDLLLTEQEQGHLLERLQDPEVVRALLAKHRPALGETMADKIVRETLEAQAADLDRRMRASGRELCEHGQDHSVCCGASKGEVEPEE